MIYVVMGPTCSGKTEVANYLIDKFDCDAINFDAFQIYQEMDIGTAKLAKDDPHYPRYHLLDIKRPDESFSVMEYQKLCREEIDKLSIKFKDIILVGGTGLYVRAALYDYVFKEEDESDTSELEKLSNDELWEMLRQLDPIESNKIHKNNRKRLVRAITLINNSDKNKTEMLSEQEHKLVYDNIRFIYISPNRDTLYQNINDRVIKMFDEGLIEEVKGLISKYSLSLTAFQGIGYKEVIQYLNKDISLEECISLVQQRTRNYAKRQVTFFKNQFKSEQYSSKEEVIKSLSED